MSLNCFIHIKVNEKIIRLFEATFSGAHFYLEVYDTQTEWWWRRWSGGALAPTKRTDRRTQLLEVWEVDKQRGVGRSSGLLLTDKTTKNLDHIGFGSQQIDFGSQLFQY